MKQKIKIPLKFRKPFDTILIKINQLLNLFGLLYILHLIH